MVKTFRSLRFPVLAALAGTTLACAGGETTERPPRTFLRLPGAGTWTVAAVDDGVLVLETAAPAGDAAPGGSVVLVPAAGTVVAVVDDRPREAGDPEHPRGNHVVIRHRADEFSVIGNLREGSVRVEPGEDVFPGRELARAAGAPSAIRYELLDAPHGRRLPLAFRMYEADGRRTAVGLPRPGETVRSLWVGVATPEAGG